MHEYKARVVDLHDGDTVHLDVDLGFDFMAMAYTLSGHPRLSCKVYGIDAPELWTDEGKKAFAFAKTLLHEGDIVTVVSHGWDKYGGRFDGVITTATGKDFGAEMVKAGHAVKYPPDG